ncbi:GGDEF domain-containing protein [Vibrio alginolyticus]
MEQLLSKVTDAGIDPSSVSGEEAITLWEHIGLHIASTNREKAHCYIISAEYRREIKQLNDSISELKQALELLVLPEDVEDILSVKASLSERLVELGDYNAALTEYVASTNIAVEYGYIDEYVLAIIGMGNLCDAYGDHQRALRYYQKIDAIDHAIGSRSLRLRYKLYMQEDYPNALLAISNVQYTTGSATTYWLSTMVKIETAYCLNGVGHTSLANLTLDSISKRIQKQLSPIVTQHFYNAMSQVYASQGLYQEALNCEKKAHRIESDLVKHIPIGELGSAQLRRLSRFELQLKLILSELENKELKETTKQHKNTVAQLQQDVFTDPLTSLHNRRWLEVKLKDLLLHDTPFALMVIDIDHFKSINDELSHLVGDKAIKSVSQELASYFKFKSASCVRFGGEEFLVILENTQLERAEMHAENYRERIYQYGWNDILGERGLTVSIGITLHREGENTQRTFYRADKALYRAKANGRNQVCTEL